MIKSTLKIAFFVLVAMLGASVLQAQVTYETAMTSNGFMGLGAFTSNGKIFIQGDGRRQETQMQFTGSIMKHLSPKGTTIEITRLDKQLFWNFNDKDKSYTELTFAEYKKLLEEGKLSQPMPGQKEETKDDQGEYEWQEPVIAAKNLGDRQKINNFMCDHYLVTVTTIGKHRTTGKLDTLLFSADMFNSINVGKAMKLISDYDLRLAEELGIGKADYAAMGQLVARYGEQMKKLSAEMRKVQGYPIRTEMVFSVTTHAMAAQKPKAEQQAMEDKEEAADPTDVKGALGGMFGKKLKDMAKARADKPKGDPNRREIFQSVLELKSIAAGDVPADQFEVPADYKLQKKDK